MIEAEDPWARTEIEAEVSRRFDALIRLIVDVDACKARHAELRAAEESAFELGNETNKERLAAAELHKAAQQETRRAQQERESAERLVAEAKWRHAEADKRKTELDIRDVDLTRRESDLKHLAGKVGEQETTVRHLAAKLEFDRKEHADAVAKHDARVKRFEAKQKAWQELSKAE